MTIADFNPADVQLTDDWSAGADVGGGAPADCWGVGYAQEIKPNAHGLGFDVKIQLLTLPADKIPTYAGLLKGGAANLPQINAFLAANAEDLGYTVRDLLSLPTTPGKNGAAPSAAQVTARKRDLLTRLSSMLYGVDEMRKGGGLDRFLSGTGTGARPIHFAFHGGGNIPGRQYDAVTYYTPGVWASKAGEGQAVPPHWRDPEPGSSAGGAPSRPAPAGGATSSASAAPPPPVNGATPSPTTAPPPPPMRSAPPPPPVRS